MDLDELYQDLILDHAKHPRCRGRVENPDAKTSLLNPLCGDEIIISIRVVEGRVDDVRFDGHGCAISQASASMMAELIRGKPIEEVRALFGQFMNLMRGEARGEECEELGDATALEGVQRFSARIKCATLAWEAIHKALNEAQKAQ